MTTATFPTIGIFPSDTAVNPSGHLAIGGCDVTDLAARFGTPLYVFDEATLRTRSGEFIREFGSRYPEVTVLYASKAFINKALVRLFAEEGMGFDVVSAGELAVVQAAGVPLERVYFHGNNKGPEELRLALEWGIGRIVVDNFYELATLEALGAQRGRAQDVLLRITPGVDPHTHAYISTGATDSKFGFPLATGAAEQAVQRAMALPHLNLIGLHMHLGSQLFETEPYALAIDGLVGFAAQMVRRHGLDLQEFSPGGGFAVQYVEGRAAPAIGVYAQIISDAMKQACAAHGLSLPRLIIEPGRSSVARAGVAVYTVGAIKDIPGVRKYVSVDGGMADNIRPALYEAKYEAVVANRMDAPPTETVTIAGKYCESGDILIAGLHAPELRPGDLLALPASGAYCLAMSSNYNASPRPAVVLVKDGAARLIRRRETYQDLMQWDE
ncbi:MAG: diaminopimelate decarboxylase [Dehalococcoidia bacterium]|nr:diaminopimelate decarboxylase [Dehalococcoidia bacterium]